MSMMVWTGFCLGLFALYRVSRKNWHVEVVEENDPPGCDGCGRRECPNRKE